jgi:hypothetical protein
MHRALILIDPGLGHKAEVPLVALLGLVHLRNTLCRGVLGLIRPMAIDPISGSANLLKSSGSACISLHDGTVTSTKRGCVRTLTKKERKAPIELRFEISNKGQFAALSAAAVRIAMLLPGVLIAQ